MNVEEHEHWAKALLSALVKRVKTFEGGDKFITYGSLAKEVGYPGPYTGNLFSSNIGHTLGTLGHLIKDVKIEGIRPPLIQAMVVSSTNKLPGDGLKEFNRTYPSLTTKKKRDFAYSEYRKIFEFGERWDEVLRQLAIPIGDPEMDASAPDSYGYNPYGSEGSPEHRALRDFVAKHPKSIGLKSRDVGITEYPLKSGDSVDVVFGLKKRIIAVEVKSERSGNDDIERGIFQCVKYSAILEAEESLTGDSRTVESILVLAGNLSRSNRRTAKALEISVLEGFQYR